jgi:hypothetical protein
MIYLIGGAPRVGKSILCQQIARRLGIGWTSTDIVYDLLRLTNVEGIQHEWNAEPSAVAQVAEWFFPYLQRLVWWTSKMAEAYVWGTSIIAEAYVIEGVAFLPEHVARLAKDFQVRAVFVGSSQMTLEKFDKYPGMSRGYAKLPEALRRQFAGDVPLWSQFIRDESQRFGYPYIDTGEHFAQRLQEAEGILLGGEQSALRKML